MKLTRIEAILLLACSLIIGYMGWQNCIDIIDIAQTGKKTFSLLYTLLVGFGLLFGGVLGMVFSIKSLFKPRKDNYYRRF